MQDAYKILKVIVKYFQERKRGERMGEMRKENRAKVPFTINFKWLVLQRWCLAKL